MPVRKNVSFNGKIRIRSVPSLDDFSKDEQNAAWFSSQDLNQIQSRERRIRSSSTSLQNALRHEIGLESKSQRNIRHSRMDIGKYSVLLEQQRQWQDETHDPETLARVLSATSQASMIVALENASSLARQLEKEELQAVNNRETRFASSRPPRSSRSLHQLQQNRSVYKSDPFSTSTSSNQKWTVTKCNDKGLSLPQRRKPKYDLNRLTGLVAVRPSPPARG